MSLRRSNRIAAMGITIFAFILLIVLVVPAPASVAGEQTISCDATLGSDFCRGDWLVDGGAEQESGVVGSARPDAPVMALQPGCWQWSPTIQSKHPVGRWVQWRYWNQVSWCFDGYGTITSKSYGPGASVSSPMWFYQGTVSQHETGGVGSPAWTVFIQGDFQACFSKWGCVVQRLPYIEVKVDGTGAYSSTGGW